ncbi:unnamed protein product [Blepharisma stoltei]|uniref:Uncharacterized protein n=1 Tax=Blepharisma stoltei TaxID=1481888 RepID=A0AAU9JKA9_9CILI|nr:unnamed protein product [Blepharisma stoltei]
MIENEATYTEEFSNPYYRFHSSTVEETSNGVWVLGHNFVVSLTLKYGYIDKMLARSLSFKIEQEMRKVSNSLHHKVLIPELSDKFTTSVVDDHYRLDLKESKEHYAFPVGECQMIPITNCSLREISSYFGRRILELIGIQEFIAAGVRKVKTEMNYNGQTKKASSTFSIVQ